MVLFVNLRTLVTSMKITIIKVISPNLNKLGISIELLNYTFLENKYKKKFYSFRKPL